MKRSIYRVLVETEIQKKKRKEKRRGEKIISFSINKFVARASVRCCIERILYLIYFGLLGWNTAHTWFLAPSQKVCHRKMIIIIIIAFAILSLCLFLLRLRAITSPQFLVRFIIVLLRYFSLILVPHIFLFHSPMTCIVRAWEKDVVISIPTTYVLRLHVGTRYIYEYVEHR